MQITEQERYWIWLSSIEGMGAARFYEILGAFLDIETAFRYAGEIPKRVRLSERQKENLRRCADERYLENVLGKVERSGLRILTRLNQDYPKNLSEIDNPPPVLYFKGKLPDVDTASCGMVGSRRPTRGGAAVARTLAFGLASQGVTIVSGMARGIDTACHIGALEAKGKTVAVLGCGADVIYPPENRGLYERIAETGAVVSEFLPGTQPTARNFPQRNRIISGLSGVLIAGEGGEKSGARITVDDALRQGRDVYAMSCDLKSPMAKLPLYLIESGAPVVREAGEVMRDQGWEPRLFTPNPQKGTAAAPSMDRDQALAYQALLREEMTADELAEQTGIPIRDVNTLLTVMELSGMVEAGPGGVFRVNK